MVEQMSQKGEKARWAEKSRGGKKQYKKNVFSTVSREGEGRTYGQREVEPANGRS